MRHFHRAFAAFLARAAKEQKVFGPEGTVNVDTSGKKQDTVETANFPLVRMFETFAQGFRGGSGQGSLVDSGLGEGIAGTDIQG